VENAFKGGLENFTASNTLAWCAGWADETRRLCPDVLSEAMDTLLHYVDQWHHSLIDTLSVLIRNSSFDEDKVPQPCLTRVDSSSSRQN